MDLHFQMLWTLQTKTMLPLSTETMTETFLTSPIAMTEVKKCQNLDMPLSRMLSELLRGSSEMYNLNRITGEPSFLPEKVLWSTQEGLEVYLYLCAKTAQGVHLSADIVETPLCDRTSAPVKF